MDTGSIISIAIGLTGLAIISWDKIVPLIQRAYLMLPGWKVLVGGLLIAVSIVGPLTKGCTLPVIPVPGPSPVVPDGPAPDAEVWKGILEGMADYIEADGRVSKPIFATMSDIEQYRNAVVSVPIRGIDGGQRVASLIGPRLSAINSPVLDDQSRAAVVAAFRDTAKEL